MKSESDIRSWLNDNKIINYIINDDYSVDVNGIVYLNNRNLTEIPVKFNKVSRFHCSNNPLTTLINSPNECYNYYITKTNIKNLIGSPKIVNNIFFISCNDRLDSLQGSPDYVGGDYRCWYLNTKFTASDIRKVTKVIGRVQIIQAKLLESTDKYNIV